MFFDRGNICVFYNIARGTSGVVIPIYNLKDGTIIDTLPSQGWATLRKEDETHFIHNGASYTALYEIDLQNYVIKEKLRQTGAGRSICYGFNDK